MTSVLEELSKDSEDDPKLAYEAAEAVLRTMAGGLSPAQANPHSVKERTIGGKRLSAFKPQAVETQLFLAEARYRTLVEQLPVVTFLAALDGGANELYVSPQIEALLGFSQKEWLED